jgi:hypothetical protein
MLGQLRCSRHQIHEVLARAPFRPECACVHSLQKTRSPAWGRRAMRPLPRIALASSVLRPITVSSERDEVEQQVPFELLVVLGTRLKLLKQPLCLCRNRCRSGKTSILGGLTIGHLKLYPDLHPLDGRDPELRPKAAAINARPSSSEGCWAWPMAPCGHRPREAPHRSASRACCR